MRAASDGGGAGGDHLLLTEEAATSIVKLHQSAANRVTDLVASVPDIDAGIGNDALGVVLGHVLAGADDLAVINQCAAAQVTAVASDFDATDQEVAVGYTALDPDLSDNPSPTSVTVLLLSGNTSSPFGVPNQPMPSWLQNLQQDNPRQDGEPGRPMR